MSRRPRLALTPGEPGGIGPDLALLLLTRNALAADISVISDPSCLEQRARELGIDVKLDLDSNAAADTGRIHIVPVTAAQRVAAGETHSANAAFLLQCLDLAVAGCQDGHFDAMVTGPLNKAVGNGSASSRCR